MDKLRLYWRASGALLLAVAALGFVLVATGDRALPGGYLSFDTPHNVLHVALGAGALAVGFAPVARDVSRRLATGVGVLYLALGVVGFINGDLWGAGRALGTHLELGENLLHLALGAWGAYVGTSEE